MLPLAILAGLIGVGMYLSRNEEAETIEPPPRGTPPERKHTARTETFSTPVVRRAAGPYAPKDPLLPAGPRGDGMVAHFTGSQVGNASSIPGILDRQGAAPTEGQRTSKREVQSFGAIHPNEPLKEIDRDQYRVSARKDGTAPFQPERTRPVSSATARSAAGSYKTVDDLRNASKPKLNAEGRVVGGSSNVKLRGDPGHLQLARRNQQDQVSFAPGGAAVKRAAGSGGEHVDRVAPHRDGARMPVGHASRALGFSHLVDSSATRDADSTLSTPAGAVRGQSRARDRDNEVRMFDLTDHTPERADLVSRTTLGGAHSSALGSRGVPGAMEGFESDGRDEMLPNRRSLTTGNARVYGSMQVVNPPKQTTYDAGTALRTTAKETMIHDTGEGWLSGPVATGVRDPDAVAKTTNRQTLRDTQGAQGNDGRLAATASVFKAPVYDPDDVHRTTTKDTTLHDAHAGQIGTMQMRGDANPATPELERTQRDLAHASYFGDAARPNADGYRIADVEADETNRSVTRATDYRGGAAPRVPVEASCDEVYTRVVGDARERVLARRAPTGKRETLNMGGEHIVRTRSKDPVLDAQPDRDSYHHQGRAQKYVAMTDCNETRGGRRIIDSSPDPSVLAPLANNPYALKTRSA